MSQQPGSQTEPQANYLVRHWRGEIPLIQAFFGNGVTVWFVFWMTIAVLGPRYSIYGMDDDVAFLRRALILIYYPVLVWQLVGIARSARRYREAGGVVAWATLAQVAVILASFLLFAQLVFFVLF